MFKELKIREIYEPKGREKRALPLFLAKIQAGFPSPADDYVERQLDLNELVIQHPTTTFFVQVEGESMSGAGIQTGDTLVVDRSLEAVSGKIIVAVLHGEFTVKRLLLKGGKATLRAENPKYQDIVVNDGDDFQVWGVVTYVIHKAK